MTALSTIPQVAHGQREHAAAMARPMVFCPWAGEPQPERPDGDAITPSAFDSRIGAYATALLRKRDPAFAVGDLSHLCTRFVLPATVLFIAEVHAPRGRRRPSRPTTLVVAEIDLPEHALEVYRRRPAVAKADPLPPETPCRPPLPPPSEDPPPMSKTRSRRRGARAAVTRRRPS